MKSSIALTRPEAQFKELLESIGYIVKPFQDKSEDNCVYMQVPVLKYSLDFAIPAHKLAIEIDGDYWHARGSAQLNTMNLIRRADEAERDKTLEKMGWTIFRITASALDHEKMRERLKIHVKNFLTPELDL